RRPVSRSRQATPHRPDSARAHGLRARLTVLSLYRRPPRLERTFPMTTRSWIRRLFDRKPRSRKARTAGRYRGFRPSIDLLEDRTLLSLTFSPVSHILLTGSVNVCGGLVVGDLEGDGLTELVAVDQTGTAFPSIGTVFSDVDVWHTDFDGSIYTASYESFAANPQGSQFGGYDVALGNFDGRHSATGKPILDIAVIGDFGLSVSMTGSRNGPIIKNIG